MSGFPVEQMEFKKEMGMLEKAELSIKAFHLMKEQDKVHKIIEHYHPRVDPEMHTGLSTKPKILRLKF